MKQWMVQTLCVTLAVVIVAVMAYIIVALHKELRIERSRSGRTNQSVNALQVQLAAQKVMQEGQLAQQRAQVQSLMNLAQANDASKGVYVICRFDLKPETDLADYTAKTLAVVPTVRREDGCRFYALLKDAETDWEAPVKNARTYWMLEKWDSVEALKAHLETPHMKAFGPSVSSLRATSTFHVLTEAK